MASKTFVVCFLLSLASMSQFSCADLIDDVCSKSRNRDFCEKELRSDPRAPNADLKGLGQVSIDISKASAQSGVALVTSLLNQAKDPISQEIYKTCVEVYEDAVEELDECTGFLKKGDYLGMNVHASAALDDPDTCDDGFKEGPNVPPEPPELTAQSKRLTDLCDIILVISNLLRGS